MSVDLKPSHLSSSIWKKNTSDTLSKMAKIFSAKNDLPAAVPLLPAALAIRPASKRLNNRLKITTIVA